MTSTTAPYCSAEDVNCWFELPKSELPEAFPRFSEDSFEATLPRGGCRGLQARPLHLVAAGSKVFWVLPKPLHYQKFICWLGAMEACFFKN